MFVPIEPPWRKYSCVPCAADAAREVPAAHDAGEAATAALTLRVDVLADLEDLIDGELLTDLELGDVLGRGAELAHDGAWASARSSCRHRRGACWCASLALAEAEDEGAVAVLLEGALADRRRSPAWTTVQRSTSPFSSKIWVMPIFLPMMPGF
jgi:hypothetical protein